MPWGGVQRPGSGQGPCSPLCGSGRIRHHGDGKGTSRRQARDRPGPRRGRQQELPSAREQHEKSSLSRLSAEKSSLSRLSAVCWETRCRQAHRALKAAQLGERMLAKAWTIGRAVALCVFAAACAGPLDPTPSPAPTWPFADGHAGRIRRGADMDLAEAPQLVWERDWLGDLGNSVASETSLFLLCVPGGVGHDQIVLALRLPGDHSWLTCLSE